MRAGATVLIGSAQLASEIAARPEHQHGGGEFLTFPEDHVREAVEAILRRRPEIVVVSEQFAKTPRGTALAHRVATDPQLTHTKVWVVSGDGTVARARPPARPPARAPLDAEGTRRAPRVRIRVGVGVQIDGASAQLIDLSTVGAQVASAVVLKPNQRVRILLRVDAGVTRAMATVVWACFELPKGQNEPRYRAGVEFSLADPELLQRICQLQADDRSATLNE